MEVRKVGRNLPLAMCLLAASTASFGATIGVYSGSDPSQIWASTGNFQTIHAAATSGSLNHQVVSTNDISQQNLNNYRFMVVANPTTALLADQMTALTNWVNQGGILLLFATPTETSSVSIVNNILGNLGAGASGTQMSVGGNTYSTGYGVGAAGTLTGSDPSVAGITGNPLAYYSAYQVSGGTLLANQTFNNYDLGSMLRVDTFNSVGKVYVFGERFDANYATNPLYGGSNLNFFVNLLSQNSQFQLPPGPPPGGGGGIDDISGSPEPATFGVAGVALAAAVYFRRRKQ